MRRLANAMLIATVIFGSKSLSHRRQQLRRRDTDVGS